MASSEQCGRNRVLQVANPLTLTQALSAATSQPASQTGERWILSLAPGTQPLQEALQAFSQRVDAIQEVTVLSGPEGGLSPSEEAEALAAGFKPVSLGHRVLRAETAPVAVLSAFSLLT